MRTSLFVIPAICLSLSVLTAQDASSDSGGGSSPSSASSGGYTTSSSSTSGESSSANSASYNDSSSDTGSSLTLPGGEGFFQRNLTTGEGRFTQPPFRYTASIYTGYDSNIYSASGTPGGGEVKGSGVTNVSLGIHTQTHARRWALTLDLVGGGFFYWNGRPDYTGQFSLAYAYKVNRRLQLSAQVSALYQSQPNFSQISAPLNNTQQGDFLSTISKFDVSYLWTRRFSTITSYSFDNLAYVDSSRNSNDYISNEISQQFRYAVTPRFAAVGEYRFQAVSYYNNSGADSTTHYALGGFDWNVNRRLLATLRAGASFRSYDTIGSYTEPFLSTSLQYAYGKHSNVQWTNRYGFEETGGAFNRDLAYRTGILVHQGITPRLFANLGVFYVHQNIDQVLSNTTYNDNNVQVTAGLQYALSRHVTLGANYTYTQTFSDIPTSEYRRHQVFVGANFSF